MKRRVLLGTGVAAAAAVCGAGVALSRQGTGTTAASPDIWSAHFESPSGPAVELSRLRGHPLLLNFWATWCAPCVHELPLLDRFRHDAGARAWQVVGLAIDNREAVLGFLKQQPVSLTIGLASIGGVDLARSLGNSSGALPFTAVFDSTGRLADHKLGVIESADLSRWVSTVR